MHYLACFLLVAGLWGAAKGADQTVLGKQLLVKDPKPGLDATKRKVVGKATEKSTTNTIVGDPRVAGATLRVFVEGATSSNQAFVLPPLFWSATATGFKYKDGDGVNGPVKLAQIKRSSRATVQISAVIAGKHGAISVLPPNPGTSGCLRLDLAGGDRYHVLLPGAPDSAVKANDARAFVVKDAQVEGLCPPTSVCGNGVRESGEECDGGPACSAECVQRIPACCSLATECTDASGFILDTTLVGICGPRTPIRGGVCAGDGSCTTHTIDPIAVCCQLPDSCYQETAASTVDLWLFRNLCVGAHANQGRVAIAASCVAGSCIAEQ